MVNLDFWAAKWGISYLALADLRCQMGTYPAEPDINFDPSLSEAGVQSRVRLEAAQKDIRLFRNNVGAGNLENGLFMRWGLANESKKENKVVKSSDLIGIRPVVIMPNMVGKIFGQFVAREIKRGGWVFRGTEEETAQATFIEFINSKGGDACFTNRVGTL